MCRYKGLVFLIIVMELTVPVYLVVIRNLPDYCERQSGYLFECGGLNFATFPDVEFDINNKFDGEDFNYTNCKFYTIPKNAFRISKPVDYFYMNGCYLQKIEKESFYSGHSNVKTSRLELNDNEIKTIPSNVFEYLPNLKHLYLINNDINTLENRCFSGVSRLLELKLSGNKIKTLPEGVFENLGSLNKIDLSNNELQYLPENIFTRNSNLRFIRISKNKLKIIDINGVRNMRVLQSMFKQLNQSIPITKISFLSSPAVEDLFVSGNYLPYISSESLSKLINLETFEASDVNLYYIELGAFSHQPYLREINLANNHLNSFDANTIVTLRYLRKIYLGRNELENFDYNALSFPTNITILHLANNSFPCDVSNNIMNYFATKSIETNLTTIRDCKPSMETTESVTFTPSTDISFHKGSSDSIKIHTIISTTPSHHSDYKEDETVHKDLALIISLCQAVIGIIVLYGVITLASILFIKITTRNINYRVPQMECTDKLVKGNPFK